jgi:hypothetical protein
MPRIAPIGDLAASEALFAQGLRTRSTMFFAPSFLGRPRERRRKAYDLVVVPASIGTPHHQTTYSFVPDTGKAVDIFGRHRDDGRHADPRFPPD